MLEATLQENLTPREQEIFNLLLEGIQPKEIAYNLQISYRTVDVHRSNLYRKLGVNSIQELIVKYKDITESDKARLSGSERISGYSLNFWSQSDIPYGGNSTAKVFLSSETIDGVIIDDVINIDVTLTEGVAHGTCWAQGITNRLSVIQQLRNSNGIRFKARGNRKIWNVQFTTVESPLQNWVCYQYEFETVQNEVVLVDIPY